MTRPQIGIKICRHGIKRFIALARRVKEKHELPLRREIIGLSFCTNHLAYVDRVQWLLSGLCRWQLGPAHHQARCYYHCAALPANDESDAWLLYLGGCA